MNYYLDELNAEALKQAKAMKSHKKTKPMTANEWRFNDYGSAEPSSSSFEAIFEAYTDYRNSQQWN